MYRNSSINEKELEKFNKLSNQWWDIDGAFKILHQINPVRLSYIINKIKFHFNIQDTKVPFVNLNILDVGCGGGLITQPLHKLGANVTGIDAIQNNIDIAIKCAKEQNLKINYIKSTIEELLYIDRNSDYQYSHPDPEFISSALDIKSLKQVQDSLKDEDPQSCAVVCISNLQYDVVLCLEVMEHVNNLDSFVKHLIRLVKPDGMIIISTINRNMKSYLLVILMAEYILGLIAKKTHDYSKFLKPSEIYSMFSKNQMEIKELKGLTYNLIDRTWRLSENIDVNYFAYIVHKKNY